MPMIARAWESMIMLGFTSETFSCIKPEMMTETATQVEEKEELGAEQIGNKLHFRIQPVQSIMLGRFPKAVAEDAFLLFYSWGYDCSTSPVAKPVAKLTQDLCSLSFIWDGRDVFNVDCAQSDQKVRPSTEESLRTSCLLLSLPLPSTILTLGRAWQDATIARDNMIADLVGLRADEHANDLSDKWMWKWKESMWLDWAIK